MSSIDDKARHDSLQSAIDSYHAGRLKQAIKQLARDAKRFPKSARHWGYLGFLYSEDGAAPKAARAYQKAARLSPYSEVASLGLFHSLWNAGKVDQAFGEMRRFMKKYDAPRYRELLRDMLAERETVATSRSATLTDAEIKEVETAYVQVDRPNPRLVEWDDSAPIFTELQNA